MKILKFGGSSVGTPERIKMVVKIVRNARAKERIAVVVSAFEGATDRLLKIAFLAAEGKKEYSVLVEALKKRHIESARLLIPTKRRRAVLIKINSFFSELSEALRGVYLVREASPKTLDFIMSFGELLSSLVISEALNAGRLHAEFLDARFLIKTDNNFGNAMVYAQASYKNIKQYFHSHPSLQVVTGFIGSTVNGETTTLGRGGSDYTAALFGAALKARTVEIWTDVPGVMSADPRVVPQARIIPQIDYEEMIELAYFGAKVVHPRTILPLIKTRIPILIKNTFDHVARGTLVSTATSKKFPIKGITAIDNVSLVNISGTSLAGIPGSAARVFNAVAEAGANVILISQASSEHTICLAVKTSESHATLAALKKEFASDMKEKNISLTTRADQAIIAVVGGSMKGVPDTAGKLFHTLGEHKINISAIAQGSSERNISFVIDSKDKQEAMNVVHEKFFP